MKKKIKDLTLRDVALICKKHKNCENCFLKDLTNCREVLKKPVLEREVEVDE